MVKVPPQTMDKIIESYTQEAGVRSLKRELAAVCRWCAREIASVCRGVAVKVAAGLEYKTDIDSYEISDYLGPPKFLSELAERTEVPGVATGLAWTSTGGEILFIEATKMKGKGNMTLTGSLGDVMKESVSVARSYIRSMADEIGVDERDFEGLDLHVHVPSGAIPKDGPSAGVTMITAITSLLTGAKVDPTVAMTGEITLRGAVLPIGGVKEKVLGAHRAGIEHVILPAENEADLDDLPSEAKNGLRISLVRTLDDVLKLALIEDAEAPAVGHEASGASSTGPDSARAWSGH
jgi:ATP-dependent Lon protease